MQLIGQGDVVATALFVCQSIMLVASSYLLLVKACGIACQALGAKKFLRGLARARSRQQVREFVEGQVAATPFSRVVRRVLLEEAGRAETVAEPVVEGDAYGAMVRGLIAREAPRLATDLHQGLQVLAVAAWAAPLVGIVAVLWCAGQVWLQHGGLDQTTGSLWAEGLVMMQLGLIVAAIAVAGHLLLSLANRACLSQFVLFGQLMASALERAGDTDPCAFRLPRVHRGVPRGAFDLET